MINILPYEQKRLIKRIRKIRVATVMFWMAAMLIVVAAALFLPTLQTINSRYQIALAQVAHLESTGVIVKQVDVESLAKRAKTVESKLAATTTPSPFEYIDRIRSIAKTGITLKGFTVADAKVATVDVVGVASTRQSLQSFIDALKNDPTVASVDSPITNFVKSVQSEFTIHVTFKTL